MMKRTNKTIHGVTVRNIVTGELVCTSVGRNKTAEFFYPKDGSLSGPDRHDKIGRFERLMSGSSNEPLEWITPYGDRVVITQELLERYPDKYKVLNLVTGEEVSVNNQVLLNKITSVSVLRLMDHLKSGKIHDSIGGFLVKPIEDTSSWIIPKEYIDAERRLLMLATSITGRVRNYKKVGNLPALAECLVGFYGHIAPEVLGNVHIGNYGKEKIIELFKRNVKNGDDFLNKTKLLTTIYKSEQ